MPLLGRLLRLELVPTFDVGYYTEWGCSWMLTRRQVLNPHDFLEIPKVSSQQLRFRDGAACSVAARMYESDVLGVWIHTWRVRLLLTCSRVRRVMHRELHIGRAILDLVK